MNEYQIAPVYDAILFPFLRPVRRKVLQIVKKIGPQRLLDVCCGTGDQLRLLKRKGFEVSGIDLSPDMVRVSQKGAHAPRCSVQDATGMSYENQTFDMALISLALHEKDVATGRRILQEIYRILRPGGHLLVVDFSITSRTNFLAKHVITFIERIAGGDHFRNFKAYTKAGGLDTLVDNELFTLQNTHFKAMNGIVLNLYQKQENRNE